MRPRNMIDRLGSGSVRTTRRANMSEPMFPDRGGREGARAPKAKCTQPKDAIDGVLRLYAKICRLHHDRDAFPATDEQNGQNRTLFVSRYRSFGAAYARPDSDIDHLRPLLGDLPVPILNGQIRIFSGLFFGFSVIFPTAHKAQIERRARRPRSSSSEIQFRKR
jgi:hypothetical protein